MGGSPLPEGEGHEGLDREDVEEVRGVIRTFEIRAGREWAVMEAGDRIPLDALVMIEPDTLPPSPIDREG